MIIQQGIIKAKYSHKLALSNKLVHSFDFVYHSQRQSCSTSPLKLSVRGIFERS